MRILIPFYNDDNHDNHDNQRTATITPHIRTTTIYIPSQRLVQSPPLLYPAGRIAYWYPTRYAQLFAPLKDGALGGHSSGPTTC